MILSFTLSMPNVGSWNGQWSGKDKLYVNIVNFGRGKASNERAQEILDKGYYHYDFGDGWSAGITVKQINIKEAAKLRKKSAGFCGYHWMVDSIQRKGFIEA